MSFASHPKSTADLNIFSDETGIVVSTEVILIGTVILVGLTVSFASVRDAAISELSDVAGSIQDQSQCFSFFGNLGPSARVAGSEFQDRTDHCDSPEDQSGVTDNCIFFDTPPINEQPAEDEPVIINSSFEEGVDPALATTAFGQEGNPRAFLFDASAIAGWQTTASNNLIEIWESGHAGVESQDGDHHVEINATEDTRLFQEFAVPQGSTLEYSVWHRGRSGVDVANVVIGPPGMETVNQTLSTGNSDWVNYTGSYTVPAGVTTIRIGFESVSTAGGNASSGNFIDNLQVTLSN